LDNEESYRTIAAISQLPCLQIKGIFSHFATADEEDPSDALRQIEAFTQFKDNLSAAGVYCGMSTIANSAAIVTFPQSHFDAVRPGLTLYGLYPSEYIDKAALPLIPAMTVKAAIVYLKRVPPGFAVSYGMSYRTARESLIATLPLGYADGLPRLLSNRGRVLVGGEYAPIVGAICMDQMMVDVTDIPDVKEYDEAVILGKQGENKISAEEIAAKSGTINYETVCRFGQRLPKMYINT
jgi:alanine racemase